MAALVRKKEHPLSGAIYEDLGDGNVRVSKGEKSGVFRSSGEYLEGDIYSADLHMLVWVGGSKLPPEQNWNRRMQPLEMLHD
ncbi:MAG: hypothetical protein ACKVVT_14260 [Dehalococcoidia bacterium]